VHVAVLIAALAEGKMPMDAASYIADAMIMSDDFAWDDEGISDALFRFSDDGAPLTKSDLEWARTRIPAAPYCQFFTILRPSSHVRLTLDLIASMFLSCSRWL
jgi:hypothetical protein